MNYLLSILSAAMAAMLLIPFLARADSEPVQHLGSALSETHIRAGSSVLFQSDFSKQVSGRMQIKNSSGETVMEVPFDGQYFSYEWNGRGSDGSPVTDGMYTFDISGTDGITTVADTKIVSVDTTPPDLVLRGETPMHIPFKSAWGDPGAQSSEGVVEVNGPVNVFATGTYAVTYTAKDAAGNVSETVRTVVVDPIPVALSLSNIAHAYDGTPKSVNVHATPEAVVHITYDGSEAAPNAEGTYSVQVQVIEPGYEGAIEGTMTIGSSLPAASTVVRTEVEKYIVTLPETASAAQAVKEIYSSAFSIEELQRALIRTGHLAISAPTGVFGPLTQTAVRFYQLARNLPQTGFVDKETLASVQKEFPNEQQLLERLNELLKQVEQMVASVKGS